MPSALMQTTQDLVVNQAVGPAWADVPGLSFPVVAGVAYSFEFFLLVSAAATTTGHALAVSGPANPTHLRYSWDIPTTATAVTVGGASVYDHAQAVPASSASATAANPVDSNIRGIIVPSASGIVQCRFKPEVILAGITVQRGSYGIAAWNG